MFPSGVFFRSMAVLCLAAACRAESALAQAPEPLSSGQHQHHSPAPRPQQEHQHPPPVQELDHTQHHPVESGAFAPGEASGTAWLPDATPMYGIHQRVGSWQLMWHGNAFAQFLYDGGDRGNEQGGSINWIMGMARRDVAGGRFGLRGMLSLEPLTIPGCGYPDLLATGEVCEGEAIHDRQHPHDVLMEAAAEYDRPVNSSLRWQVYGGLVGEPALGPAAYPHRISAMPNPLAPISHHWLDATHITFGVVTGGVYNARWKAEASVFNGREPDAHRWDFDFAALDSVSGRFWFAPGPSVVFQVSAGHLSEAEPGHDGGPRVDVKRVTASATYHSQFRADSIWATTAAWGRNAEAGEASNAYLLETSLMFDERDTWFGRIEAGGKPAHALDVHGADDVFSVAKLQAGYTRYLDEWRGLKPGFGGSISAGFVPESLEPIYGSRVNLGFGIFVTVRPAVHRM
ncbi:MAG: hypothetical protein ACRD15_01195 [Vicinamibacterales bacterium]